MRWFGVIGCCMALAACESLEYAPVTRSQVRAAVSEGYQEALSHRVELTPEQKERGSSVTYAAQVERTLRSAGLKLAADDQTPEVVVVFDLKLGEPYEKVSRPTFTMPPPSTRLNIQTGKIETTPASEFRRHAESQRPTVTTIHPKTLRLSGLDGPAFRRGETRELWRVEVLYEGFEDSLWQAPMMLVAARDYIGANVPVRIEVPVRDNDPAVTYVKTGVGEP